MTAKIAPVATLMTRIVLGFLVAVLNLSCSKTELTQITLAESSLSVPASLSFIAREKGFWREQGLEVKVVSFAAGRLCLDAVLSGQAQFATAAETPLATGAFRHHDFGVVCETMNTTTETKVIGRRQSGIVQPSDLKGKKIGVYVGTQAEYFLDAFLAKHGMKRSDVTVVNLQPPDQIIAIVHGDVDAIVAWQPHAYNAIKQLGDSATVFSNEGVYTGMFCMASLRDYARNNPAVVDKFIKGLIQAEEFVRQNPGEASRIIADHVGIEPASLAKFYGEYDFKIKLSPLLLTVLQREGQWTIDTGVVPADSALPHYEDYLLPAALERVDKNRVTVAAH